MLLSFPCEFLLDKGNLTISWFPRGAWELFVGRSASFTRYNANFSADPGHDAERRRRCSHAERGNKKILSVGVRNAPTALVYHSSRKFRAIHPGSCSRPCSPVKGSGGRVPVKTTGAGKSHRGCGCAEIPRQKRGDSLYAPFETCAMLLPDNLEHGFS